MQEIDYTYLFAGVAVLIALLSLWANLWVSFGRSGKLDDNSEIERRKASATLGLIWIYSAILISLMSVAFILMGKYWENLSQCWRDFFGELGFSFLITAFIMAIINMFESTWSAFWKGLRGITAFHSYPGFEVDRLNWCLLSRVSAIIVFLLTCSSLGVMVDHRLWWGYLLVFAFAAYTYLGLTKRRGR